MPTTSDFRNGMTIRVDGELWTIVEFQHVNPGNWRAFVRTKLKNLKTGKVIETRFRAGESIEIVRLETRELQYLYSDSIGYIFMDNQTYEQISVPKEIIGDRAQFLKESETVSVMFNGTEVVTLELPVSVNLKVVETVPGVRGDTATGAQKPAKVETGATVNVPLFINEGDIIKVDTRTGEYLERIESA